MPGALFDENTLRAVANLKRQDDEFCRIMRLAIELGRESCPIGVSTQPGTQNPRVNYQQPDPNY
jgi:hypothetical protein